MLSAVKNLRRQLLMTQEEFGKAIGCSRVSVMKYETERAVPRGSTIKRIMDLAVDNKIKVNVMDFLKDED